MLNKELLMLGGSYTNSGLPTKEEFKEGAAFLRALNPDIEFLVFFSPDIDITTVQLDTIADAYGSDITTDYTMTVINDSNYIYITHSDEHSGGSTYGYSGGSPYALYLSGIDALNYKLLYRTNDPTNQTTVDYWKAGDLLRILKVPNKFDGFIIAQ